MKCLRNFGWILSAAVLVPLTTYAAPPQQKPEKSHSKISKDAAEALPFENIPVIIQYKQDPSEGKTDDVQRTSGSVKKALHSIHALSATVPAWSLGQLASDPDVSYISLDRPVAGRQVSVTAAEFTTEPINANTLWQGGYLGTNIGVAVLDSGISPVADFDTAGKNNLTGQPAALQFAKVSGQVAPGQKGRIVYSQNFVPAEKDAVDTYGHGTHVAGLIAGNGSQSTGTQYFRTFSGSAPNANLINLRVLDADGAGTDSSVIAGIEAAISLKKTYNIRVINLSLGRPIWESYTLDPLCQAVERAWKAGIVVVVAAGNDGRNLALNAEGYGTIEAPGNDPYVITVGATRTMGTPGIDGDLIASYSSKGPSFIDHIAKPDIVAPGNLVVSLAFDKDPLAANNPGFVTLKGWYATKGSLTEVSKQYFPLSGTSMATGVTSGAVALLLQAEPELTPDQVKATLMRTANRSHFPQNSAVVADGIVYNATYDVFTIGAGYLDIDAALKDVDSGTVVPAGTAMSPVATYDAATGATTLVIDQTALWDASRMGSTTALWGASKVYGSNVFRGSSTALWGATGLWGADDPSGFSALWGATALWGSSTPEAATALWGATEVSGSTDLTGASRKGSSTALWGASRQGSSTALWGASRMGSTTALWGASRMGRTTALWGATAPLEF